MEFRVWALGFLRFGINCVSGFRVQGVGYTEFKVTACIMVDSGFHDFEFRV